GAAGAATMGFAAAFGGSSVLVPHAPASSATAIIVCLMTRLVPRPRHRPANNRRPRAGAPRENHSGSPSYHGTTPQTLSRVAELEPLPPLRSRSPVHITPT